MSDLYSVTFDRKQVICRQINPGVYMTEEKTVRQTIHGLPHQTAMSYQKLIGKDTTITVDIEGEGYRTRREDTIEIAAPMRDITPVTDYAAVINEMVKE